MPPGPLESARPRPDLPRPDPARSFADVGYDEAMRRAAELIPFLREHATLTEKTRGTPPVVLEALHRTGLLRAMQPKARGGMELDFVAYFDLPEMLARGDMSVAWVLANLASHHRGLALFDPRAQEEVWGEDPDALIASGIAYQQGRARRVDGGLIVSGSWGFSSGSDIAGWNQLAVIVREGDRPVDWCYCMMRLGEYQVVDDWHTLGMRGTGSCTVRCDEVFVPEHRVLSMHVARPGHAFPGHALHANPMYRVPTSALGGHCIGACMAGNAQAALDATIDLVRARSTSYTGAKMRDFQTIQVRVGDAGAKIDAARLLMRNDCLEAAATCAAGDTVDIETRLRYKRNCALGAKLCLQAVDCLHELAGAHGIYDHHPLQRMFRDAHAAAGHFSFSVDAQFGPWALVALGGDFRSPTL